jgi:hypothetical protein
MIKHAMLHFCKYLSLLTLFLLILGYILFSGPLHIHYLPVYPWMLGGFIVLNLLTHSVILNATKNKIHKFNTIYFLNFGIKMFSYILFLFLYMYFHKEQMLAFVFTFGILYISYTILEISSIFFYLKQQKKANNN